MNLIINLNENKKDTENSEIPKSEYALYGKRNICKTALRNLATIIAHVNVF